MAVDVTGEVREGFVPKSEARPRPLPLAISLYRSDLLISDWSGMAIEYALGLEKPVLFIDVPPRVRNPDYEELGIDPIERFIRSEIGAVVSPDDLQEVPLRVEALLAGEQVSLARFRRNAPVADRARIVGRGGGRQHQRGT